MLDGEAVLPSVSPVEIEKLIRQKKVSGGMLLKLEACTRALNGGVSLVHIVEGTLPQSLIAALNGKGVGTRVLPLSTVTAGVNL